jgi:hypothetical protein
MLAATALPNDLRFKFSSAAELITQKTGTEEEPVGVNLNLRVHT